MNKIPLILKKSQGKKNLLDTRSTLSNISLILEHYTLTSSSNKLMTYMTQVMFKGKKVNEAQVNAL